MGLSYGPKFLYILAKNFIVSSVRLVLFIRHEPHVKLSQETDIMWD